MNANTQSLTPPLEVSSGDNKRRGRFLLLAEKFMAPWRDPKKKDERGRTRDHHRRPDPADRGWPEMTCRQLRQAATTPRHPASRCVSLAPRSRPRPQLLPAASGRPRSVCVQSPRGCGARLGPARLCCAPVRPSACPVPGWWGCGACHSHPSAPLRSAPLLSARLAGPSPGPIGRALNEVLPRRARCLSLSRCAARPNERGSERASDRASERPTGAALAGPLGLLFLFPFLSGAHSRGGAAGFEPRRRRRLRPVFSAPRATDAHTQTHTDTERRGRPSGVSRTA